MKLLFWGTPAYAVPSLDALVETGHELVGVVTQPDRRRGRGKALQPSAVKARALELGVPVFTPERIRREPELQQQLAGLGADASVVVAFGQILPTAVLDQPPLGCWNGHGSLLPRWRGAAPIQWALIEGDAQTGVGIMAMEEGLDTGAVLLQRSTPIQLLDNAHTLGQRLSQLTAELLVEALPQIAAAGPGSRQQRLARLGLQPQSEEGVRYARLLSKDDFQIDWQRPALALHRQVMGLYPGASTSWRGQRLKLLATEPLVERLGSQLSPEAAALLGRWPNAGHQPGEVLAIEGGLGLVVSTGGCPLLLRQAQLEGKAASEGTSLLQQLGARPGDPLGS
ncbi:MAG: methionyl-tRNA formyltransferase [Cyanobacteriota bacterium]|nr:methionyl-tRNA formyltransferase [Cyanobacteriota bacterium]